MVTLSDTTHSIIQYLPETHKPGNQARKIFVEINFSTRKLAKYLLANSNELGLKSKYIAKNRGRHQRNPSKQNCGGGLPVFLSKKNI